MKTRAPISLFVLVAMLVPLVSAQTVNITPSSQAVSIWSDDTVVVDMYITGVTDLAGFQFDLLYSPALLSMQSPNNVTEGTFLSDNGTTDWTAPDTGTDGLIDNAACVKLKGAGPYMGVDGSGTLANMRIMIDSGGATGRSYLNLSGVKLSDRDANPISFSIQNASVDVQECVGSETRPCTYCGKSGTRTCTGGVWGACDVICDPEICNGIDDDYDGYVDNIPGMNQNYTLTRYCSLNYQGICGVGNETCLQTVGWSGCPQPATELCNAVDEDCDGDSTECAADVTNSAGGLPDGCVNLFDLIFVSTRFGLVSTDAGWDARADLVSNNEIDIFDLVMVARDFGNGPSC